MPRITEELIRKRAEHNNGEICTLEELSLHQQDLERIEYLDRLCCHLKILYLQNNLIARIENVGRLKELEYLNLALNNLEKIENLEGCEFLQKLDFTVNFIGDLLSVESLRSNIHLRELFLTGNPCTEFKGYREYVVATLPQLDTLDGKDITKSERISACQQLDTLRECIVEQQKEYAIKRELEKKSFREKQSKPKKRSKKKNPGFDSRWYTDSQAHIQDSEEEDDTEEEEDSREEEPYTPEYRIKNHRDMEKKRMQKVKEPDVKLEMPKRVRKLEKDGKMLNVNEGRYDFHLRDDGDHYILEVDCPKYMDTSLIACDLHTTYVRLEIKTKILQLVLQEEISPDASSVKRSQVTGNLLLTLCKAGKLLVPSCLPKKGGANKKTNMPAEERGLKVNSNGTTDEHRSPKINCGHKPQPLQSTLKRNSSVTVFQDDPTVPPLI